MPRHAEVSWATVGWLEPTAEASLTNTRRLAKTIGGGTPVLGSNNRWSYLSDAQFNAFEG